MARAGHAPCPGSLAEAVQLGLPGAAADLLAAGCDVDGRDAEGNTALHWAAARQPDGLLESLLAAGARPDARNARGETPAHCAARAAGAVAALGALLGADSGCLQARDQDGFTPFLVAVMRNDAALLEWMWLQGAEVDDSDDLGRTALQWACYKDFRRTAQWLLSRGACVGARDHGGMTALHWAAVRGNYHVAKMLANAGAHIFSLSGDCAGDTPAGLAFQRGHRGLGLWLLRVACAARFVGSLATASGTAALFPALLAANAAAFGFALRGREAGWPEAAAAWWPPLAAAALALWLLLLGSDPGCLGPRTLQPQHERLRRQALEGALDLWRRPLEEQVDAARLRDVELRAVRSALGDSHKEAAGEGLERLERLQQRLGQQRRLLASAGRGRLAGGESWQPLRCCGSRPEQGGGGPCELQPLILSAEDAEGELARMAGLLPGLARSTAGQLGRLRLLELLGRGGGPGAEYAAAVQRGDLQHLCTVCRRCRTLRSYHCKECGRCVERLDHHCPWIDNCVGLGNQRLFYAFLVCIVLALGLFLLLGGVELWSIGERAVGESLEAVPLMGLLVVLALDAVFGGFAAMLLVRQTAYMVANVTTYEVLVVPKHVQRRFPCRRTGDRLWFLRGCSLSSGLASCVGYWSRDLRRDLDDFGDPAEGVAPLE